MPKSRTRPSKASGALAGALLFGASPAFAQMTVFDPWNYAIQGALQSLQQGMSSTLTAITNQLTATGPLGTLLGSAQYGSVTALLQQGFTQNANYAKAQVDAQSQIIDGALTSNARFPARYPQRIDPRRTNDKLGPLRRARRRPDGHRLRRAKLEGHSVHSGRRR